MSSEQLSIPDAEAQRNDAVRQADAHAEEEWKTEALEAIRRTCLRLPTFISDDIWNIGELASTREDRALGPQLTRAKKLGYCVKTGEHRPSVRSHLSAKPVWRSLIYRTPFVPRRGAA